MNILITGGSGFLGRDLTHQLIDSGNEVTWASRSVTTSHPDNVKLITYENLRKSDLSFEVIINLAGAGVADRRWSDARKELLLESRLIPTQAVLDYISQASVKPKLLLSSSAIGWYGIQNGKLTEDSTFHDEFSHQLCDKWEALAKQAESVNNDKGDNGQGVPTVILRTGIVISPDDGMVKRLRLPFSMGAGGKLGNGEQMMSWISREDWTRAVSFIIDTHLNGNEESQLSKVYNLTNPTPMSNATFTRAMGKWLKRPVFFCQPRSVIELIFGEMAVLLVDGQTVMPQALLDADFEFKQTDINETLSS